MFVLLPGEGPEELLRQRIKGDAQQTMDDIYQQVADDAVKQYGIVSRNGSAIDRCVHAGMVTAAFAQAKDEARYAQWKDIERRDCRAAGVPQFE